MVKVKVKVKVDNNSCGKRRRSPSAVLLVLFSLVCASLAKIYDHLFTSGRMPVG